MKRDFDDETLMAFADGELDTDATAELEAALATDDALAERLAVFMETRSLVGDAFRPLIDEPVPAALSTSVAAAIAKANSTAGSTDGTVVEFRPKSSQRTSIPGWMMGIAASIVVVAVGLGGFLAGQGQMPGSSRTQTTLASVLNSRVSGEEVVLAGTGETAHLIASFRNPQQHLCREYELRTTTFTRLEIACDGADGWVTRLALTNPASDGYTPASAAETLDAFLTAMGAGEPLSPEDEKAALAELQ